MAERSLRLSRRKLAVIGVALAAAAAGCVLAYVVPSRGAASHLGLGFLPPLLMIGSAVLMAAQRRRSEGRDG